MKLTVQEKIELKARAKNKPAKRLSRSRVLLHGEKIFKKIQNLVSLQRTWTPSTFFLQSVAGKPKPLQYSTGKPYIMLLENL